MTESANNSLITNKFLNFLKENGLRRTPERSAILEQVLTLTSHFSNEELCAILETRNYHVSRATVYNTLNLLVNADVLIKLNINGGVRFQQANSANYIHLICTSCGKIKNVKDNNFIAFMHTRKFTAFTPTDYSLCVNGICNTCARAKKKQLSK